MIRLHPGTIQSLAKLVASRMGEHEVQQIATGIRYREFRGMSAESVAQDYLQQARTLDAATALLAPIADPRNYHGDLRLHKQILERLQTLLQLDGLDVAFDGSKPKIVERMVAPQTRETISAASPSDLMDLAMADLDDKEWQILEYLEREGAERVPSAQVVATELHIPVDAVVDELVLLEQVGLVRSGGTGRFSLTGPGQAMLAARRKNAREAAADLEEVLSVARRLISRDVSRSRENLARVVGQVLANCSARGILQSGAMLAEVEAAIVQEMRDRGRRVIETLTRTVKAASRRLTNHELRRIYEESTGAMFDDAHKKMADCVAASAILNAVEPSHEVINSIEAEVRSEANAELDLLSMNPPSDEPSKGEPVNVAKSVFIGHGRAGDWRELKDFIVERLHLRVIEFDTESTAGIATKERLEAMLDQSSFALLVATAEDTATDGTRHARENVIHEIGLFQGRLGFRKAIVVIEEGCSEFTNITGVGQLRYSAHRISSIFEGVRRVLEREKIT